MGFFVKEHVAVEMRIILHSTEQTSTLKGQFSQLKGRNKGRVQTSTKTDCGSKIVCQLFNSFFHSLQYFRQIPSVSLNYSNSAYDRPGCELYLADTPRSSFIRLPTLLFSASRHRKMAHNGKIFIIKTDK